jgi:hypothetical protein
MWDDAFSAPGDPAPTAPRVLVAVMTSPRDWELVQRECWYRIPLARAPSRLAASYLAFYHTGAFPGLRYTISHYAPIERYDVVRRADLLPEEPNHPRAQERYYRLALGPMLRLARPIPSARLRRVTFIPTTLPRLLNARELGDLWDHPTAQQGRWRAMRLGERTPNKRYFALATAHWQQSSEGTWYDSA